MKLHRAVDFIVIKHDLYVCVYELSASELFTLIFNYAVFTVFDGEKTCMSSYSIIIFFFWKTKTLNMFSIVADGLWTGGSMVFML